MTDMIFPSKMLIEMNLLSKNPKYEETKFHFCGVLGGGGLHKSMSTNISEYAYLITVGTYVQQGEIIKNQFFIYGPECECFFCYLRGSGGLQ